MIEQLKRPSLTRKFLGYFLLIGVFPLLFVGGVSYRTAQSTLEKEASHYVMAVITDQKDFLELHLDQIESLLANVVGVEAIQVAIADKSVTNDSYTRLVTQSEIGYILNGYSNLTGLVSIDIFTTGQVHYHVGDTLNAQVIRSGVRDALFVQALNSDHGVLWAGIEDNVNANSTHKKVLTTARVVTRVNHQTMQAEPLALFLVNYSIEALYEHFHQIDLGANAYLMILDGHGRYIYHPNQNLLGEQATAELRQRLRENRGTAVYAINGQDVSISHIRSTRSNWVVVGVVPLSTLTASTATINQSMLLALAISFTVVILVSYFLTHDVVIPIRQLTNLFKQLPETRIDQMPHLIVRRQGEIAELFRWFNAFLDNLAARQQAENQIQASLREKEALLKEIHHRVKNNLQIISSLLSLQMGYAPDNMSRSAFEDGKHRVRSMALIHEKLYQSQNLAQVDLAEYIEDLVRYLSHSYQLAPPTPTLRLELEKVYLTIDTAVPCGLILNELITNTFKHAFPPGQTMTSEIFVALHSLPNNEITLVVADNGVGLHHAISWQTPTTLGLQLVNTLVRQLNGRIELTRQYGFHPYTTAFIIHFTPPDKENRL